MSFIGTKESGRMHAAGYFLASADCARETRQFAQNSALVQTAADGSKYVPMGTPYPTNDANAVGIAYEDVDVSTGAMAGSVVTCGRVYEGRIPVELNSNAKNALIAKGFVFISAPSTTRPDWTNGATGGTTGGTTGDTEGATGDTAGET